jgi:hypothetical protein
MTPDKQERCPSCGSDSKPMNWCGNPRHGKIPHAYVAHECIRCFDNWHSFHSAPAPEGKIVPTKEFVEYDSAGYPHKVREKASGGMAYAGGPDIHLERANTSKDALVEGSNPSSPTSLAGADPTTPAFIERAAKRIAANLTICSQFNSEQWRAEKIAEVLEQELKAVGSAPEQDAKSFFLSSPFAGYWNSHAVIPRGKILELAEAYAASTREPLERENAELKQILRKLRAGDPYQYVVGSCCGDAHASLESALENVKFLGFEIEVKKSADFTEHLWKNSRAEKAERENERLKAALHKNRMIYLESSGEIGMAALSDAAPPQTSPNWQGGFPKITLESAPPNLCRHCGLRNCENPQHKDPAPPVSAESPEKAEKGGQG